MPPLEFQPILKQIRWGGRRLGTVLGKPIGNDADYAESWEIADHCSGQSTVRGGIYDGWTLARLLAERNLELFGRHAGRSQFPLLVKFLDAHDRLSVQVHPDDEQARRFDPRENGKTEAWVILAAEPGSRLYVGLNAGVDELSLRRRLASGTIEDCLHSFEVSAGQCVFLPAGTVHAIGEGLLLAEIQQSSDLTFRLDDWGRVGADGKPRPLHIDEAISCIDFGRGPILPVVSRNIQDGTHQIDELVACEYFVMRRHSGNQPFTLAAEDRFRVLMMLEGHAQWSCGDQRQSFPRGRTVLLPAAAEHFEVAPAGEIQLLEAILP